MVGYGSKCQLQDVEQAKAGADRVLAHLNEQFGAGKWMAVFGGDSYNEEKPDIAVICKHIQDQGVPLLAIQCSKVDEEWGGVDWPTDLDAVHYYPTDLSDEQAVLWGGRTSDGKLVGGTRIYLGEMVDAGLTKAMCAFGGGKIAAEEAAVAADKGLPVIYCPLPCKFPDSGAQTPFGPLHDQIRSVAADAVWVVPNSAVAKSGEGEAGTGTGTAAEEGGPAGGQQQ